MKSADGAANTFDTALTAFEGANSTLFLLLGGLSCFQRLRTVVAAAEEPQGSARPAPTSGDAPSANLDHVTLAVLGLLAAGQRLTNLCTGAAAEEADRPSPSPARRRTQLRTMLR